ncbi:alpha-keto acid decarboxylase family protein [Microbacterium trichothecenolyticum]|uniref:Alpha-keto-acid decarboxylase n=1 Tax=Microbacterium trichothecenolyticum TaxID=69370 RepID=A0ABU0TQT3_MICTR|nr:thiamine pyrophosphate-binding protein [Microbacterium trichothecenolyticum]MDQ1122021.1 TPP-dependent 2-oxoacid decarboxylase [Microbacterium trichothecenolyticum]
MDAHASLSVGRYLAHRLLQIGAAHVFGLPGDFNLTLLDEMVAVDGLHWAGSTNELNAAYAADGYARVGRRCGALVTTFGVGELSAVNGIAGSYAEDVPVLHIVGMPSTSARASRTPLHHTFLDGDVDRFVRIAREVAVACEVLRPDDAAQQIDDVVTAMLTHRRPAYLGIPLDLAGWNVDADRLRVPLRAPSSDPAAVDAFRIALRARLATAADLTVLAGARVHRQGLEATVAALADHPGVRIASQTGAKALLDEDHPASLGTYLGAVTRSDETRDAVDDADPLVLIGAVFSDFTTGFFTQRYDAASAIQIDPDSARIAHAVYPGVRMADAVAVLTEETARRGFPPVFDPSRLTSERPGTEAARALGEPLTHAVLWPAVQRWLQPGTTVIAEAGTSFYGAVDLVLPPRSDLLGQPVWSSIGYTLPAALGAALARPEHRPVLFIGDGSAQLTIQELGALLDVDARPVVFVLDNAGYTVERLIQSPDAVYQDIRAWDWEALPPALGARRTATFAATTDAELRDVLAALEHETGPALVRLVLDARDAPRLLLALTAGISATNTH